MASIHRRSWPSRARPQNCAPEGRSALLHAGHSCRLRFYLQSGRAKLRSYPKWQGSHHHPALRRRIYRRRVDGGRVVLRMATATAIIACVALNIEREEMVRVLHEEHALRPLPQIPLHRSMKTQADLVNQALQFQREATGSYPSSDGGVGTPGESEILFPRSPRKAWRR